MDNNPISIMITIYNILNILKTDNPVKRQRIIIGETNWRQYKLLYNINIQLSNGKIIKIPAGFEWDLSSSPRLFWPIFPPDGDFEIAALIHDYLYRTKIDGITRKFADKEMYIWSKIVNKKHIDNRIRYIAVRMFGRFIW